MSIGGGTVHHPKSRYLKHPTWALRMIRNRVRDHRLWVQQGRPTDTMVVVAPGQLTVSAATGKRGMTDWRLSSTYMEQPIDIDTLWERLSATYPVVQVS
jgi:hypothetical protein